jgi:uncharacterized damage-inducible protein DinB
MDVEEVRQLLAYNRWANQRVFTVAEQMQPEQTRERLGTSFDSIHGNLGHILGAEIVWLSRLQGNSPRKILGGDDFQDVAELGARWTAHDRELAGFAETLTPARLAETVGYTNTAGEHWRYTRWQMLMQLVNHGTHHRSEVADLLTRLGSPPPGLDFLIYYDETRDNPSTRT